MEQQMQQVVQEENPAEADRMAAVYLKDKHITMLAKKFRHSDYDILGIRVLGLSPIEVENACPQVQSGFLAVLANLQIYLNKSGADIGKLREKCQCGVEENYLDVRVMQEFAGRESISQELLSNLALVMKSSDDWEGFFIVELDLEKYEIVRPSGNPPNIETVRKVLDAWKNVNSRNQNNTARHLLETLRTAEQNNVMQVREPVQELENVLENEPSELQ